LLFLMAYYFKAENFNPVLCTTGIVFALIFGLTVNNKDFVRNFDNSRQNSLKIKKIGL